MISLRRWIQSALLLMCMVVAMPADTHPVSPHLAGSGPSGLVARAQIVSESDLGQDQGASADVLTEFSAFGGSLDTYDALPRASRLFRSRGSRFIESVDGATGMVMARSVRLPISRRVTDLAVDGTLVYVTALNDGLLVLDAAEPTRIGLLARFRLSASLEAMNVTVANGLAYVATQSDSIAIIDVGDPSAPKQIATISGRPDRVLGMLAYRSLLFVSYANVGIYTYDVSDPIHPSFASYRPMPGEDVLQMETLGDRVYFTTVNRESNPGLSAIHVTELSEKSMGMTLGSVDTGRSRFFALSGDGTRAFLAGEAGLTTVEFLPGEAPVIVDRSMTDTSLQNEVSIAGGKLHTFADHSGHLVFNQIETQPKLEKSLMDQTLPEQAFLIGSYAFVADASHGFDVFDLSTPAEPSLISSPEGLVEEYGELRGYDIAATDKLVYLAAGAMGLFVFEYRIENGRFVRGTSSRIDGHFQRIASSEQWMVAGGGRELEIGDGAGGDEQDGGSLAVFDARANAQVPRWAGALSELHAGSSVHALVLMQERLVIVSGGGLERLSLDEGGVPKRMATRPGYFYSAARIGEMLVVSEKRKVSRHYEYMLGFYGLDDLSLVAEQAGVNRIPQVEAWRNLVFAVKADQLMVLDASDPDRPRLLDSRWVSEPQDLRLRVSDDRLLVSSIHVGVKAYLLAEPPPTMTPIASPRPSETPEATPIPAASETPVGAGKGAIYLPVARG